VRRVDGAEEGPARSAVSPLRARGQLAIEPSYLPPPRSSCAVIYRPYLKPANCLFKHNKTAVPPFNLRGSPFRVRGPCRLPPKPPPGKAPLSLSLSLSCAIVRPPFGPFSRSFVDAIARFPLRTYAYGRAVGFSEKGVPYITAVITNGIIGYTATAPRLPKGGGARANLTYAKCQRDTFARLANGGENSTLKLKNDINANL